jgi:glyoxylase-like metal-dependent hydrolase (beta-lactamase superfamily II)
MSDPHAATVLRWQRDSLARRWADKSHSPGSIALRGTHDGVLFTGDVIYDDEILDDINGTNIADYAHSLRRLRSVDVSVVYPGHGPSFDEPTNENSPSK